MATSGLKEMGKFFWEGREKGGGFTLHDFCVFRVMCVSIWKRWNRETNIDTCFGFSGKIMCRHVSTCRHHAEIIVIMNQGGSKTRN